MVKIKSLDETVLNYGISSVIGAWKYWRYYVLNGYDPEWAREKAVKYAWGQLFSAGAPKRAKEFAEAFKAISQLSGGLAEALERMARELKSEG